MRLYTRGTTGTPLATIDVSAAIGLSPGGEADFEDAARIGNRIYVISSHGRSKSGRLERARYHFFAMDLVRHQPRYHAQRARLRDDAARSDVAGGELDHTQHRRAHDADCVLQPEPGDRPRARPAGRRHQHRGAGMDAERVAAEPAPDRVSQPAAGREGDRRVAAQRRRRRGRRERPVRRGDVARSGRPRHPRHGLVAHTRRGVVDRGAADRRRGAVPPVQMVGRRG